MEAQKTTCIICKYKMETGDTYVEHVIENHADKLAMFIHNYHKDFRKALYDVFFE